jgi:cytochrome c553
MESQTGMIALAAVLVLVSIPPPSSAQTPPASPQAPTSSGQASLHGQKLVNAYCAGCHRPDGNSSDPQYPKIAGQKDYYLRSQLSAFKRGTRKSDVMSGVASTLSNAQIAELARFFSRQKVRPDTVKDRKLAELGARIFRYRGRRAPPCAACHSPGGYGPGMMGGRGGMMGGGMMRGGMMGGMMGNTAAVPNLFGQHAGYTVQQLDAFAGGKRRGAVMGPIAAGLTRHERQAVAEYLSGRR